jgi:hypothetical protein
MTSYARKPTGALARRVGGLTLGACSVLAALSVPGCLDRPVTPVTSHAGGVVATKLRATRIDKVDLLIVVDNSTSMEDKQSELGSRIPTLITSLINPPSSGGSGGMAASGVADLHVGIITSSLGSFGTSACPSTGAHENDHGHLLPRSGEVPAGSKAVAAAPLSWVVDAAHGTGIYTGSGGAGPGTGTVSGDTTAVVQSAGDDGCGYEAGLEAAYHFLADPNPYQTAAAKCTAGSSGDSCSGGITVSGTDTELLNERKAFLRPDSLLSVILLTDEDDGSLNPSGQNWIPWALGPASMPHGWASCATVPDSVEDNGLIESMYNCWSCIQSGKGGDANCKTAWPTMTTNVEADGKNNRQVQQVQKYGYEFLWPTSRYVAGFTNTKVVGSDGMLGTNPIFQGGNRTQDLVIVAAITGVPEDLVANADHSIKTLSSADWAKITSDDHSVRDYRMIEGAPPRTGAPKYKGGGDLSADPYNGTSPFRNGNGGDRDILNGDDLQYACIQERSSTSTNNDCVDAAQAAKNPLCVADASGGTYTQKYYKAYPGLRQLRLVQALGTSGFAASICAKDYSPAIQGILTKIQAALNGQCISSVLTPDAFGQVPCVIDEVFQSTKGLGPKGETSCEAINPSGGKGYCTPGKAPCRVDGTSFPTLDIQDAAASIVLNLNTVDAMGSVTVSTVQAVVSPDGKNVLANGRLVCEEYQIGSDTPGARSADATSCQTDASYTGPSVGGGWCYSTNTKVIGDKCVAAGALGTVKFTGTVQPNNGSEVFTVCIAGGS